MGKTLAYKILENHLVEGTLAPGEAITIKIDQTLTQDSTGTMVYLQLEAMEVDKVKTELSVAYIDHNTLQTGFENADEKGAGAMPAGISRAPPEDTACCSPSRATASATSFSWKTTVNRARLCWAPTATLQRAAVWA